MFLAPVHIEKVAKKLIKKKWFWNFHENFEITLKIFQTDSELLNYKYKITSNSKLICANKNLYILKIFYCYSCFTENFISRSTFKCAVRTGSQFKTVQQFTSFALDFQRLCTLLTLCKLCYFFISMGFGTVFVVHSSSGSYLYCIRDEKAGNFVPLMDRVNHRKQPKSPISTHRMATIFKVIPLEIFDHICSENRHDLMHFTDRYEAVYFLGMWQAKANFEKSRNEAEQKFSQLTKKTVWHIKIKTIEKLLNLPCLGMVVGKTLACHMSKKCNKG